MTVNYRVRVGSNHPSSFLARTTELNAFCSSLRYIPWSSIYVIVPLSDEHLARIRMFHWVTAVEELNVDLDAKMAVTF